MNLTELLTFMMQDPGHYFGTIGVILLLYVLGQNSLLQYFIGREKVEKAKRG